MLNLERRPHRDTHSSTGFQLFYQRGRDKISGTGDNNGARNWLEQSIAADPDNFKIRKTLGQVLLALKDFDAAKQFAEETIRLANDNADAHRVLGHALLSSDDFSAAADYHKHLSVLNWHLSKTVSVVKFIEPPNSVPCPRLRSRGAPKA